MSYFCGVKIHEKYINRCIELAHNGLGTTYPNPLVGSVIVCDGIIIGEGWHKKAGEPHAEVNAIQSVKDQSLLSKSTLYVSLEPCSHYGKTPPCAGLIVKHKIPNVVIGTVDPNLKVAGKGIEQLKNTGVNVVVGVLQNECIELNKRFFTFHTQKRPFIILKWAESIDGFIAPSPSIRASREPVWITDTYSRQLVHKWRSEEQALLVGTQTVLDDNPKLNVRDWSGNQPIRIVIDRTNRIPKESYIFDNQSETIIFTETEQRSASEKIKYIKIDFSANVVHQIVSHLYQLAIQSVLIEGGKITLQSFIDANLWDEARIFKGTIAFSDGVKAPELEVKNAQKIKIGKEELQLFQNYDYDTII